MAKRVLLIVSAYNEEESIVPVVTELIQKYAQFDYVIVNDDVAAAANKLKAILVAEKCRSWRNCDDASSK